MKEVSGLCPKLLQRLEWPFSREWLTDFSSLIGFIQTNSLTQQILEEIKKEKVLSPAHLIENLKVLTVEGKIVLKKLRLTKDPAPCGFFCLKNSVAFSKLLIASDTIALMPGTAFGVDGSVHFAFSDSEKNIHQALHVLKQAINPSVGETS